MRGKSLKGTITKPIGGYKALKAKGAIKAKILCLPRVPGGRRQKYIGVHPIIADRIIEKARIEGKSVSYYLMEAILAKMAWVEPAEVRLQREAELNRKFEARRGKKG